jgi:glutaredoxin
MKSLFILLSLISFLIAADIKEIKSIKDLSSTKDIFLMFSIPSCPWCIKQLKVLKEIEKERNLQIVKVEDSSSLYKELVKKYPFPVDFYPTTFIVSKEDNELNIDYEFQGYQKKNNITKVLDNKDNF